MLGVCRVLRSNNTQVRTVHIVGRLGRMMILLISHVQTLHTRCSLLSLKDTVNSEFNHPQVQIQSFSNRCIGASLSVICPTHSFTQASMITSLTLGTFVHSFVHSQLAPPVVQCGLRALSVTVNFNSGQSFLVCPSLPHCWRHNPFFIFCSLVIWAKDTGSSSSSSFASFSQWPRAWAAQHTQSSLAKLHQPSLDTPPLPVHGHFQGLTTTAQN